MQRALLDLSHRAGSNGRNVVHKVSDLEMLGSNGKIVSISPSQDYWARAASLSPCRSSRNCLIKPDQMVEPFPS
jgi:phage terminase large subunit-like protein